MNEGQRKADTSRRLVRSVPHEAEAVVLMASSQGLSTTQTSSKCRTFRVATGALRTLAMPAIWRSRISRVLPCASSAAERAPAFSAALVSNGRDAAIDVFVEKRLKRLLEVLPYAFRGGGGVARTRSRRS